VVSEWSARCSTTADPTSSPVTAAAHITTGGTALAIAPEPAICTRSGGRPTDPSLDSTLDGCVPYPVPYYSPEFMCLGGRLGQEILLSGLAGSDERPRTDS